MKMKMKMNKPLLVFLALLFIFIFVVPRNSKLGYTATQTMELEIASRNLTNATNDLRMAQKEVDQDVMYDQQAHQSNNSVKIAYQDRVLNAAKTKLDTIQNSVNAAQKAVNDILKKLKGA